MSNKNNKQIQGTEPLTGEKPTTPRIPTLEEILRELDMEKYLVPDDDVEAPAAFGGLQGSQK